MAWLENENADYVRAGEARCGRVWREQVEVGESLLPAWQKPVLAVGTAGWQGCGPH